MMTILIDIDKNNEANSVMECTEVMAKERHIEVYYPDGACKMVERELFHMAFVMNDKGETVHRIPGRIALKD